MCYLLITLLVETETIIVPSIEKGTEIMAYLRQTYYRLVLDETASATVQILSITLQDQQGQLLDHIDFQSFFGTSEFEGVQRVIHSQLNPSS